MELHIREIYHDWFKDSTEDDDTAATREEIEKVLAGQAPLPPGAIIHFGVDPDNCEGIVISWTINGPGKTGTDVFAYDPAHTRPYEGELSKIKPRRFNGNAGHAGLIVTYPPGGGGPSNGILKVEGRPGGGAHEEASVAFPWVAKG